MKHALAAACVVVVVMASAPLVDGQAMTKSPASPAVEARLDMLAKKMDEQNAKIDMLSQQILKLEQQLGAGGRPGVMIGEGAPPPAVSTAASTASSTSASAAVSATAAAGNSHIVARGETLTSIAKANNVSVAELQRYNHIDNPLKLQAGQTIVIPPATSPTSSGE